MIVLIALESDFSNEIATLHQLFDAGLSYFHLRKPYKSEDELIAYIKQIDPKYYKHIVIHHYHHLAKEFGLKGVHLQEQNRIDLKDELHDYVHSFSSEGFTVSSSFHDPEVLNACDVIFDYHLLSPVFNAISKQGYQGKGFSVNHIDKKIIGMGGVTAQNLSEIKAKGFAGAGVLGGVWLTSNKVAAFKALHLQQIF